MLPLEKLKGALPLLVNCEFHFILCLPSLAQGTQVSSSKYSLTEWSSLAPTLFLECSLSECLETYSLISHST